MCGRTACTLGAEDVRRACCYKDGDGKLQKPDWRESPNGNTYYPSQNIAPTKHTPVMLSRSHFKDDALLTTERIIQPMYWGLVPFWFKDELKSLGMTNNNARSETVLEKRTFSVPLKKGQRCVVIADGYYEWQTDKGKKQPHLIYFPQPEDSEVEDRSGQDMDNRWSDTDGWSGPRLLTMAGIFDVCKLPQEEHPLYSYCILTMDASPKVSWIHERMPVILDGDDAINSWLEFGHVPLDEAMKLVKSSENLTSHPVSALVNNSRNKGPECMKRIDPTAVKSTGLMNWLKTGKMDSPKKETKPQDSGTPQGSPQKVATPVKVECSTDANLTPVKQKSGSPQKTLRDLWNSPKVEKRKLEVDLPEDKRVKKNDA